jgi:hypothetical protein
MTSRIAIDIELTIDQRIEIIEKIDQHFDILDFGIGPIPEDIDEQDENIHRRIDSFYPGLPRTTKVYYTIN